MSTNYLKKAAKTPETETFTAQQVVTELFTCYQSDVREMPPEHRQRAVAHEGNTPRIVADYIAGMTDRFAIKEHMRLTGTRLFEDVPI